MRSMLIRSIVVQVLATSLTAFGGQPVQLRTLLARDGRIKLPAGFSGTIDPKGFRMVTAPGGAPSFVPSAEASASDTSWDNRFSFPGLNGSVYAMASIGGNLYVGGAFTSAGASGARYIAKWNGSGWSTLGTGVDGEVYSLAVSGSDLYVGGLFFNAGGSSAHRIAKWNGSSWSALGAGLDWYPNVIAPHGSDIYVGGLIDSAGGSPVRNIARWNGSSWSALGAGVNGTVYATAFVGTDLYAGGFFDTAGVVSATGLAKWNGIAWSAVDPSFDNFVYSLASIGTDLYVGGEFTHIGLVNAVGVAKWDGASWSALGAGLGGPFASLPIIHNLTVSGTDLYAAGSFSVSGTSPMRGVAKWNGAWAEVGGGVTGIVSVLCLAGSDLYAGGTFGSAGGVPASNIANWNASSWSSMNDGFTGLGLDGDVLALAAVGSDLFVGGAFTIAGSDQMNYIARWDGSHWYSLGTGMNHAVLAFAVIGMNLFVGGLFDSAGGAPAAHIAKWDGANWSPLGSGLDVNVLSLTAIGTDLYAGGWFNNAGGMTADGIAKWDGSSWSTLGGAFTDGVVEAVTSIGTELYVGGFFSQISGTPANNVAKWNGTSWSALGSGTNEEIYVMAVIGKDLYVGGFFDSAGGSRTGAVAKWDGSSWSSLGSGLGGVYPWVYALGASGTDLYAAGPYDSAGGIPASGIARWDGSAWSTLGSGVDDHIHAIGACGDDLYFGGRFGMAGGKLASCFSRWKLAKAPSWVWANEVGGSNSIVESGIATDDSGNVYVTGYFAGSVNFGSGTLSSAGGADIFLTKYDRFGSIAWATTAGGTSDDASFGIAIDRSGNVYLAGAFQSASATFDTVLLLKPGSNYDVFVAKYNRGGRALWARAGGGTGADYGQSIATDWAGNAYIAGYYLSPSIQFGGTPPLTNAGSYDIFVAKYSSAGTALWASGAGGGGDDEVYRVAADSSGNAYCVGYYTTGITFGANPPLSSGGLQDAFVVKYNTSGSPVWSRSAGGTQRDDARSVAVDKSGSIYVAGAFASPSITLASMTFFNVSTVINGFDPFIVKYSSSGTALWAHTGQGVLADPPAGIVLDAQGNVYMGGSFASPSVALGKFTLANTNGTQYDLYFIKYDSLGNSRWIKGAPGGTKGELPAMMAADPSGNILVGGNFSSSLVRFDAHTINNHGVGNDAFVAKLGSDDVPYVTQQTISVKSGWNLVSVPVIPAVDSVKALFPGATSRAYAYVSGAYAVRNTMNPGAGYWLKFAAPYSFLITGAPVSGDTVSASAGWNLIGSITQTIPTSSVTSIPGGIVTGRFFTYAGTYIQSDSIVPGSGYWVKTGSGGSLVLSSGTEIVPGSTIKIVASSELPPPPPEEDEGLGASSNAPCQFSLEQNYPNPFNPSTVIKYGIPDNTSGKEVHVVLKIYNIIGEEVAALVDEMQEPGMRSVRWDAGRFPSGVYFYKMTASHFTAVHKLLLIK